MKSILRQLRESCISKFSPSMVDYVSVYSRALFTYVIKNYWNNFFIKIIYFFHVNNFGGYQHLFTNDGRYFLLCCAIMILKRLYLCALTKCPSEIMDKVSGGKISHSCTTTTVGMKSIIFRPHTYRNKQVLAYRS